MTRQVGISPAYLLSLSRTVIAPSRYGQVIDLKYPACFLPVVIVSGQGTSSP
jgi:hypothetical protein